MELVGLVQSEYYLVDFGMDGRPTFAGGPVPEEVLEMFTGRDEDEDIMEGYFCNHPAKDPEAVADWLATHGYVVLTPEGRKTALRHT